MSTRHGAAEPRRWIAGIVLGLLCLFTAPAAAQDTASGIRIRQVTFDEDGRVQLVVQPSGPGADALQAQQVAVTEAGQPVSDVTIERLRAGGPTAVAVALLIDVSGSMIGPALDVTRVAAADFVDALAAEGIRVAVVTFGSTAQVIVPFGADPGAVRGTLAGLVADGDTSLYDAVLVAADALARVEAQRNIVLFSDGGDTASVASLEDAVTAAASVDAPVTSVALVTGETDVGALERLAGATGGTTLATGDIGGLDSAFGTVAVDLTTQYLLTFQATSERVAELDLAVTWTGVGGPVRDVVTIVDPRAAAPVAIESYTRRPPGIVGGPAGLYVGLGAAFVAMLGLLSLLLARPGGRAAAVLDRELAHHVAGPTAGRSRSSAVAEALRVRADRLLASAPRTTGFDHRLQHRLDQASWPLRSSEFLAMCLGAAAAVGIVGLVFLPWWGALPLAMAGGLVPVAVLNVRRGQRRAAFLSRFPDTLQLLAGSLRAGYGILQAFDSVGRESGGPTGEEFARVLTESRLGMPLEDSLDDMADRLESDDVRWVVMAIKIQREVGGNLAALLSTVADTLREREALRRQIKVLSAEGKLSAVILIVLPFLLAIYLTIANNEYVRVLTESALGWGMVAGGITLMVVGVFWIRRMIKIEV